MERTLDNKQTTTEHHYNSKSNEKSQTSSKMSDSIFSYVTQGKGCLGFLQPNEPLTCDGIYFAGSKELHKIIPFLLEEVYLPKNDENQEYSQRRISALRQLYELTVTRNEMNRIPLVCTSKWDIIAALAYSISHNLNEKDADDDDNHRRIACLTLNNLSVPYENKAVMSLGNSSNVLIASLTQVINLQLPESYLCFICLMNLTHLEDAVAPILYFSPNSDNPIQPKGSMKRLLRSASKQKMFKETYWTQQKISSRCDLNRDASNKNNNELKHSRSSSSVSQSSVLFDPQSFINSTERIMKTFRPFLESDIISVEKEAVRWALGLLRNITKQKEHCALIIETEIPALIVSFIETSKRYILEWTEQSIEESSLLIMCNLVHHDTGRAALKRLKAQEAIEPIIGEGGIHDFRASMIQASLSATDYSI